jgi:hypothetical protein
MKHLFFSTLLFYAVFASGQAFISHDVVHQDGATASMGFSQDGGFISLDVSRGTVAPGNSPQAFIIYEIFSSSPDGSLTETFASGSIPSDSLHGDSAAHMTLNLDTSQASSFTTTTCTFTFFPQFTESCVPGALGVIQLDWIQSHNSTTHSVVSQTQVFNQARIETHQDSDTASAVVTGSFLGIAVNAGGTTGVNHGSTLELFRFH